MEENIKMKAVAPTPEEVKATREYKRLMKKIQSMYKFVKDESI